jgi:hypothetical protein
MDMAKSIIYFDDGDLVGDFANINGQAGKHSELQQNLSMGSIKCAFPVPKRATIGSAIVLMIKNSRYLLEVLTGLRYSEVEI